MAETETELIAPPWIVLEPTRKEDMPPPRATPRPPLHKPESGDQITRRDPGWQSLRNAFDAERIRLRDSVGSEEPELVVVIEVAQSVDVFLDKVEGIKGLEFLFEDADERMPDDDFYFMRKSKGSDELQRIDSSTLNSTVYFVFTDAVAVEQLLSLWAKFKANPSVPLPQPWKKVFTQQVEDVRAWAPQDRLTQSLKDALQDAETEGIKRISIEVELWYRQDREARAEASRRIRDQAEAADGTAISECVIEGIDYHALLVEFPIGEVESFFSENPAGLVSAKQVMHLHRNTQASVRRLDAVGESPMFATPSDALLPTGTPRVALLDGLPMSNHGLLVDRLAVDDPDERERSYPAQQRQHGTAMASVIIHGDLSEPQDALQHPLYVRPILEAPERNRDPERYPANELICDVVHRAIVRMCEGEGSNPSTAAGVKIVNLSIGDPNRHLARHVSPLARLLDYLAHRYDLLFVVSAGNHPQPISYKPQTGDFSTNLRQSLGDDLIDRRLLSPAESINALTVGALNSDRSDSTKTDSTKTDSTKTAANLVEPVEPNSPALYSAVGRGCARSVKPEIFAPGGRQVYRENFDEDQPVRVLKPLQNLVAGPGVLVAQPGAAGSTNSVHYWRGTSLATAHVTRFASDVLDRLELLQADGSAVPDESLTVLTKALVVHASNWGKSKDWETAAGISGKASRKDLSRLLGYGRISPSWLFEDAPHRATLVATDELDVDEQAFFEIPLPEELRLSTHWRRLRLTLAWFSPINPRHRSYRRARLALEIPSSSCNLLEVNRTEVHQRTAMRGTVQHELLDGTNAPLFKDGDSFGVLVTARPGAGAFESPVRFGLVATLETAAEADIAVREQMRQRVRVRR